MTLLKAKRLPVLAGFLCLLLMGFAGASYGSVRFNTFGAPTEVINTGRSEVTGAVNLVVDGTGNVTGTSTGGSAQIGLIYSNPALQIDNQAGAGGGTGGSGIKLFFSSGFTVAFTQTSTAVGPFGVVQVANQDINGRCAGFLTINMAAGATPAAGDFIRIEGVRGRIDVSLGITPGTDLYVDLQSINDPSADIFSPDEIRVAKSLDGMNVAITSDTLLLCFPTLGKPVGSSLGYAITITEGFARAFVDNDTNNDGALINDRTDSGSQAVLLTTNGVTTSASVASALGLPLNQTQFLVWFESIPSSVSGI